MKFMGHLDCDLTRYKISYVETLGDGVFIECDDGHIYMNRIIFTQSPRQHLRILYRQYLTLDFSEGSDGTRGMLSKLISKVIAQTEKLHDMTLKE